MSKCGVYNSNYRITSIPENQLYSWTIDGAFSDRDLLVSANTLARENTDRITPSAISTDSNVPSSFKSISCCRDFLRIATTIYDRLVAWGSNIGFLGMNDNNEAQYIPGDAANIKATSVSVIDDGKNFISFFLSDGVLLFWDLEDMQDNIAAIKIALVDENHYYQSTYETVYDNDAYIKGDSIVKISNRGTYMLAVDNDGNIYSWVPRLEGDDSDQNDIQIGTFAVNMDRPSLIVSVDSTVLDLIAQDTYGMVLTKDNLYSWGYGFEHTTHSTLLTPTTYDHEELFGISANITRIDGNDKIIVALDNNGTAHTLPVNIGHYDKDTITWTPISTDYAADRVFDSLSVGYNTVVLKDHNNTVWQFLQSSDKYSSVAFTVQDPTVTEAEDDCFFYCQGFGGVEICIPQERLCDQFVDCFDGSDEADYICNPEDGMGGNDFCYNLNRYNMTEQQCDGVNDCGEYPPRDESNCDEYGCKDDNLFTCTVGSDYYNVHTTCLFCEFWCNGIMDCLDGHDEMDCEGTPICGSLNDTGIPENWLQDTTLDYYIVGACEEEALSQNYFDCQSVDDVNQDICISPEYVCDTYQDCYGNVDENNCTDLNVDLFYDTCSQEYLDAGFIDCEDHDGKDMCINARLQCDYYQHCKNNEDESLALCPDKIGYSTDGVCTQEYLDYNYTTCDSYDYPYCMPPSFICNGMIDCWPDGNDEDGCPTVETRPCTKDEVDDGYLDCRDYMQNDICVPDNLICNYQWECSNGEDEMNCNGDDTTDPINNNVYSGKCDQYDEDTGAITCMDHSLANEICVLPAAICDYEMNCYYGEDESDCENDSQSFYYGTCNEFDSNDGAIDCYDYQNNPICVIHDGICDNNWDCQQGEDENDCHNTKEPYYYGNCNEYDSNDGAIDCYDYQNNPICVIHDGICDNNWDCQQGEDENDCHNTKEPYYYGNCNEYDSNDGAIDCYDYQNNPICVIHDGICDNNWDCQQGEDENDCHDDQMGWSYGSCTQNDFMYDNAIQCEYNQEIICVFDEAQCDGHEHCDDGSDEEYCNDTYSSYSSSYDFDLYEMFGYEFDFECDEEAFYYLCMHPDYQVPICAHLAREGCNGEIDCYSGFDEDQSVCDDKMDLMTQNLLPDPYDNDLDSITCMSDDTYPCYHDQFNIPSCCKDKYGYSSSSSYSGNYSESSYSGEYSGSSYSSYDLYEMFGYEFDFECDEEALYNLCLHPDYQVPICAHLAREGCNGKIECEGGFDEDQSVCDDKMDLMTQNLLTDPYDNDLDSITCMSDDTYPCYHDQFNIPSCCKDKYGYSSSSSYSGNYSESSYSGI